MSDLLVLLVSSQDLLREVILLAREYNLGVITSLLATVIFALIGATYKLLVKLKPSLSLTRRVDEFERRLIARSAAVNENEDPPYEKYPSKWRNLYYVRERDPKPHHLDHKERHTYRFFIEENVRIQLFMGFLIPSLDGGHGRKWGCPHGDGPETYGDPWSTYLDTLRELAEGKPPRKGLRARYYRARWAKRNGLPDWSRIVFFNRRALTTFIDKHKEIYPNEIVGPRPELFETSAGDLKNYVLDICLLHSSAQLCHNLEWRYVEETAIPTSEYYDFGLYIVQGIPIVYTPIPFRNDAMDLAVEKIYIGRTYRRRQAIFEFVRDYKYLWKKSDKECKFQSDHKNKLEKVRAEWQDSDYLIPEAFDLLYGRQLKRIVRDKWNITFKTRKKAGEKGNKETAGHHEKPKK